MTTSKSEFKRLAVLTPVTIAMKLFDAEKRIKELEAENARLAIALETAHVSAPLNVKLIGCASQQSA